MPHGHAREKASFETLSRIYHLRHSSEAPESLRTRVQLLHMCTNSMSSIGRPWLPEHELLNWLIPIVGMHGDPSEAVLNNLLEQHAHPS